MKMEKIGLKSLGKLPLPGERQGTLGAIAESDSIRDSGGRVLNRRTSADKCTTADTNSYSELNTFIRHNIIGDGSCLFRATSLYLYGNQEHHEQLRKESLIYIYQNWLDLQEYVFIEDDRLRELNNYIEHMGKTSTYGTSLEILALSDIKNVNFCIYSRQRTTRANKLTIKDRPTVISKRKHKDNIHLLLSGRPDSGHFELLTPEESQNKFGKPPSGVCQDVSKEHSRHNIMRSVNVRVLGSRNPGNRQATVHQQEVESDTPVLPPNADLPVRSSPIRKTARRRAHAGRMKWSRELNSDIMRAFYYVNQCDDVPLPGWRNVLYAEFIRRHPELHHLTEQNIADRKNIIIKKSYLTQQELETLKREVGNALCQEEIHNDNECNSQPDAIQEPVSNEGTDTGEQTQSTQSATCLASEEQQQISEKFYSLLSNFSDSDPMTRPNIPILKNIAKAKKNISLANEVLADYFLTQRTIQEVHLAIYCAAVTVIELNGQKTYYPSNKRKDNDKNYTPAWRRRLETDIQKLRAKVDLIGEYLKGHPSNKVTKKVTAIALSAGINTASILNQEQLLDLRDRFRQKYKAKAARLRRYNELTKRKNQNSDFTSNRKRFFAELESKKVDASSTENIDLDSFNNYWSAIWSEPQNYKKDAHWVEEIEHLNSHVNNMCVEHITAEDVLMGVRETGNWKSPGPDKLHNFWIKYFPASFSNLASCFTDVLKDPTKFPGFLTEGNTYMLLKKGEPTEPKNYRPITCLSAIYKLFTSIINNKIYEHCIANNILEEEQKGCIRGSMGTKHQLTIDAIVLKQVQIRKRNVSMCYVDYAKAFDSVPHDWLVKVLELYKVCPTVINMLKHLMSIWKTNIFVNNNRAGKISISRGIFQGDSLSPLWFCLAMNPLSSLLRRTKIGYKLNFRSTRKLSHLLYMDDLKLYAENIDKLNKLLDTVQLFSDDIKMSFGLDKCAIINIKKGKVVEQGHSYLDIETLPPGETYKYLGAPQNQRIDHTQLKKIFTEKYSHRVTKIMNTKLSGKNQITAINTWAVPVLTHTFGILKWSDADLNEIDRLTRRTMTKFRCLHTNASVRRLYLPRRQGGRGLVNIYNLCRSQEQNMRSRFLQSNDTLMQLAAEQDHNFTPLKLQHKQVEFDVKTKQQEHVDWSKQAIHGIYPRSLENKNIDKEASLRWLKSGQLYPETEGFLMAIQDRVIRTRNYEKHCLGLSVEDKCRKCGVPGESIEHIIAGCQMLANNAYLGRHNQLAKIIHQQLALKNGLLRTCPPYYKYQPSPVLETSGAVLYWDRPITTDRTVDYNRPDIVLIDKQRKVGTLIDISVPLSHNIAKVEAEKIRKYENLAIEIKQVWQLQRVTTIPFVISAEGILSESFIRNLKTIGLSTNIASYGQKAVLLQTCHIVRKFLN